MRLPLNVSSYTEENGGTWVGGRRETGTPALCVGEERGKHTREALTTGHRRDSASTPHDGVYPKDRSGPAGKAGGSGRLPRVLTRGHRLEAHGSSKQGPQPEADAPGNLLMGTIVKSSAWETRGLRTAA